MKKRTGILAIALAALVAAGCGGADKSSAAMSASVNEAAMDTADYGGYEESAPEESYDDAITDTSGIETPVSTSQKLIKTVDLAMETREFDTLLTNIQEKVTELGGYTENSNISGTSYYGRGNRYAWLRLRIPVEKLDGFVTTVSDLGNVTSKNESVDDITLQYVDTESHKKALETEQERLLTLMEQAENVDDIIQIESRLSEIRYELQNYESTLRTYDNQVNYSTVTIDINEVERESSPEKQSFGSELKTRLSDNIYRLGQDLRAFSIWFIASLPYFIILAAIAFVVIKVIRKLIWKKPFSHKKNTPNDTTPKE